MVSGDIPTLTKTDPFPPKGTKGLRLYSGRFCPFAHRTRLVLNAKDIPYEIVNLDLREKPDWYKDISALGKVPLLEENDSRRIVESLVIAEYLDDVYHDARPLLPTDALGRAKQKMLVEVISSKITGPHQQVVLKGEQENKDAFLKALDDVESMLDKPFMAGKLPPNVLDGRIITLRVKHVVDDGEQLGFVDLMVWPWFERLPAIEQHRQMSFPVERYPKITAWCQRMRVEPAVKATAQPTEIYAEFYKTRNPNVGL